MVLRQTRSIFGLGLLAMFAGFAAAMPAAESAGFAILVAAPGPDALADQVLQEAIDTAAARGGGVVELGPGEFKLSRHAGDETVVVKSGITLRGQGYATHVYLDPATPPNPLRYYPVRIGSELVPAEGRDVVIENMRYTGNNAKIGGGSIMGFNARIGDPPRSRSRAITSRSAIAGFTMRNRPRAAPSRAGRFIPIRRAWPRNSRTGVFTATPSTRAATRRSSFPSATAG
ncbi:MAG: hypothetical protein WDN28_12110 [Chthoniobacter sp.]